jgi:L-rhamnose mutarotase
MQLKLACADFTFPLLSHDASLELIAALGFNGVDIGLFEERSHLWPSREFANVERSARTLRRKLANLGLAAADVFLQTAPDFEPFAINHPQADRRQKARDWFLASVDYAAALGCAHITALPGVHFESETLEDSMQRSDEELAWRVEKARQRGLIFAAEAHVGSIAPDPQAALAMVQRVDGLTLTLDYTHFTRGGLADESIEPLVPYASHFHARAAQPGRIQTLLKYNTIDYARIVELLAQTDYHGWVGIEYVWVDWEGANECDNVSETVLLRDLIVREAKRLGIERVPAPGRPARTRKAFVMSVLPGQEGEYEKRHNPIWPELQAVLKDHGVHNYSIFLDPDSRKLFAYVEIEDEQQWQSIASTDVCRRWWQYMQPVMPSNPDNSPIAADLREVFHLD